MKSILSYTAKSVKSSLYRNGKVYTRRDTDGNDDEEFGYREEKHSVPIHNARLLEESEKPRIGPNGFELLERPLQQPRLDFYDHREVVQQFYPECAEVLKQVTGTDRVFAFDHNIRSAADKGRKNQIAGGQQVQGPIHCAHGDYTLTSAPQRLRDLSFPPGVNDTLRSFLPAGESLLDQELVERALSEGGRFALINLWRNIDTEPIAADPLALCDAQSVHPDELVVYEIHYRDRIGENYMVKFSPDHEWWFYPAMTRDEVVLIKQWDSTGMFASSNGIHSDASADHENATCTFSFHTAFEDPDTAPGARDRKSIEVRCVVIY